MKIYQLKTAVCSVETILWKISSYSTRFLFADNAKGASLMKEGVRFMKRPREVPEQSSVTFDDCEPDEKRPTFRLNPPTLIHGQAKSVPKEGKWLSGR